MLCQILLHVPNIDHALLRKKILNQSDEASSVVREWDILLQCLFSDIGTGFRLDMSGWRIAKHYSTIVKQLA